MNKWPCLLLTTLGLAVEGIDMAQAALKAVDPGPYTASTGHFPHWYQDSDDLSLELCQSKAQSPSAPGSYMCTLIPEPGVFDDTQPMVFPNNWPSELFWFAAETDIPAVGGSNYELEVYVAAIEAAFAQEVPRIGDQQSFARIRIRASIPTPGTYRVTHPYGVETINVTAAQIADKGGRRAINMTRDIGIGAPGVFNGALTGNVGPFLQGSGAPYPATNPETGEQEFFIGDPNVPSTVTGSPFGTNYVEISGPAGTSSVPAIGAPARARAWKSSPMARPMPISATGKPWNWWKEAPNPPAWPRWSTTAADSSSPITRHPG
ncbi:hypothetical protein D3C84_254980 [compost metagenome]